MDNQRDVKIINAGEDDLPFKYGITSYGADFDVEGLVKRINRGDIRVPPLQRKFVWNITQSSRFIESLLLGLPVPGIFLSKEEETEKLLVIDGQQRLHSLAYFYEGTFKPTGKEFSLTGIKTRFRGKTYNTLQPEDRRRLDDSIIHATIVRQDEPDDGNSSIYFIFARLNTGGTQLQPQEIRDSLFHGSFNEVLSELNTDESWRKLYGPISPRKRDIELILRFFAFLYRSEEYQKPITEFLNNYMGSNRNLQLQDKDLLKKDFLSAIHIIEKIIGDKAFKPKRSLNAAIYDSIMIGISRRLKLGIITNEDEILFRYKELLNNPSYIKATETGTSDEDSVRQRLELSTKAFGINQ